MPIDSRNALRALTAFGSAEIFNATAADTGDGSATSPRPSAAQVKNSRMQIVMLVHPDMTALDLVAPQLIFATMPNTDVHLVWKELRPVTTDSGLKISPSMFLDEAPVAPDLLFIPGGLKGTTAMMQDAQVLDFVRTRGEKARWVTSVCTGGLLLGAAGLLKGYRATTHWYVRNVLPIFDATPVNARVVVDRNRITGGGVTAGIDMALTISAAIHGDEFAQRQTLVFEYSPQPPFASGTPELAGQELTDQVLKRRGSAIELALKAAMQASSR